MLLGTIGCNIAWGLIDAIIFLMTSLTERARGIATRRALRQATDTSEARAIITETSPPLVAGTMDENDFEAIRRNLGGMSEPPPPAPVGQGGLSRCRGDLLPRVSGHLSRGDTLSFHARPLSGAQDFERHRPRDVFFAGFSLGHHAQHRPLRMGLTMMLLGSVLVMITSSPGG
jgi:hypothetical protein